MQAEDLKDWTILKSLDTSSYRKVFVFVDNALILKKDGIVVGIGFNTNKLLSNCSERQYINLTNISLPTKIKDFTTNGEHSLAISEEGYLYSWGCNEYGQLGRDGDDSFGSQVEKVFAIKIKEAICGTGYSCVLTEDERVFEWGKYGFNELVLELHNELDKPDDVKDKKKIISLFGTKHYPVILTDDGKVFIPSFKRAINKCSHRLHTEKTNAFEGPLKNKKIKQVLGGKSYAFALTGDGEIFKWTLQPIYACNCNEQPEPKLVDGNIGRIVEIWAATSDDVLVAANSFGCLYSITWNAQGILPSISRINFSSAGKYFAKLEMRMQGPVYDERTMYINMEEGADNVSEWRARFEPEFNTKEGSDIAFVVSGGLIYAHRAILSIQSSYLKAILQNDWKENSEDNHITIKEYSYETYLKYLRFLYTGKIELSSHEGNLELLKLAHEYMDKTLLDLCKKMLIQGLTVENSFSTYNVANILGLEDVRQACKRFTSKNLEDVILSEDISNQEDHLLLTFMRDMVCSKNIVGEEEK